MRNVLVLPHQGYYLQAPSLFPEIRWFFLICGYGAGKTQANVFAVLNDVKRLQGKKNKAGSFARLMVCGYTLSHLEKTFMLYFRQYLDESKTPYTESKKYNMFQIGTVTVIMQPLENPENIFGYDVHKVYVEEADELTSDKLFEAIRSLNERCRQVLEGERPPALCLSSTSQGCKGLYYIYNHFKKSGVGFVLIRGRTEDNPYLPKELVQDMKKTYTEAEREVFMNGKFLMIAKGRVLPGFDWERNFVDYDLDNKVRPDETILWGQDINCIAKGEKVSTLRGDVPIEQVVKGDLVLTRQGYKKVINCFNNGTNFVSHCATLYSTSEHIFRTPEGDRPQWQVKKNGNVYYLPKHMSFYHRIEKMAEKVVSLVKGLSLMELSITGFQDVRDQLENILSIQEIRRPSMSLFGNIIMGLLFRKGLTFTISTVLMTIDLKRWLAYLRQYIRLCTQEIDTKATQRSLKKLLRKQTKPLESGIKVRQVGDTIVRQLKEIGKTVFKHVLVPVLSVVKNLQQRFLLQKLVQRSVVVSGRYNEGKRLEEVIEKLNILVQSVERRLKVLKMQCAAHTDVQQPLCGLEVRKARSSKKEYLTNVYDLEVEDTHEYFVNGTLVHNCGYNRGSAYIIREGTLYAIKYYDFPDLAEAPKVVRHDFPLNKILWLPDVTIKDSFPAFSKELRKYQIKIIYRKKSPDVEDSSFLVSKLFYTGRLIICKIARDLAEACANAMRDKNNQIPKGVGQSSPIHAIDGLRYVATFVVARYPGFEDMRRLIVDKHASLRNEQDKEVLVKKLGSGYMEIDPEAYVNSLNSHRE